MIVYCCRHLNMLGVDQSQLADWLYPPQYCLVSSQGETRAAGRESNPDTLRLLFSDSVTESQVLQVLVVRGERCLVTDLAQSPHQDMAGWLVRLLTVLPPPGLHLPRPRPHPPALVEFLVSSPGEARTERAVLTILRYSSNPDTLRL